MNYMKASQYRLMVWIMNMEDFFHKPGAKLMHFGIQRGQTVVDYGCGPGRYLAKASLLAGKEGRVYAADISPVALRYVRERLDRACITNVTPVLIENGKVGIEEHSADVVYALDMFQSVSDPQPFFATVRHIIKHDGLFYLEDGHQSRQSSKAKIALSPLFSIYREYKRYMVLKPNEP